MDNINGPDDLAKATQAVVGDARILEDAEPIPHKKVSGSAPSTLLGDGEADGTLQKKIHTDLVPVRAQRDEVLVSHVSPRAVKPGDSFILEIILHIQSVEPVVRDDLQVEPAISSILLASGTELLVELTLPDGFSIDERGRVITWHPPSTRIQFMVTAANGLA